jgi:hypothetical protein
MTYSPPAADVDRARSRALIVGAVGLVGCAAGFLLARDHFFRAWLVAFMVFLSIGLGSMAAMMVQHLTGGAWGVFRRIFEASSRTLPLLAILFVPVALGIGTLYPWSHPDHVAADEILRHRAPYLNTMFWMGRAVFFFAGWIGLSMVLNRLSRRQDSGDVSVNLPLQRWCGFGIVFWALTMTFAGIDWIMALNPHWFSTLFGFLMIAAQGLCALAFTIIAATFLFRREPMSGILKPYHFHDLGKLMFAFTMLWTYFSVSQLLIIWSANLPEEVPFYLERLNGPWRTVSIALLLLQFVLPFLFLLWRDLKRNPQVVRWVALVILIMRVVDITWTIGPVFRHHGSTLHWLDFALVLAIGLPWLAIFWRSLAGRPLVPARDPYYKEAMAHVGH